MAKISPTQAGLIVSAGFLRLWQYQEGVFGAAAERQLLMRPTGRATAQPNRPKISALSINFLSPPSVNSSRGGDEITIPFQQDRHRGGNIPRCYGVSAAGRVPWPMLVRQIGAAWVNGEGLNRRVVDRFKQMDGHGISIPRENRKAVRSPQATSEAVSTRWRPFRADRMEKTCRQADQPFLLPTENTVSIGGVFMLSNNSHRRPSCTDC